MKFQIQIFLFNLTQNCEYNWVCSNRLKYDQFAVNQTIVIWCTWVYKEIHSINSIHRLKEISINDL